jgi:hypothetical protein
MRIVVNVLFTELIRVLVFFATADLALFMWDLMRSHSQSREWRRKHAIRLA